MLTGIFILTSATLCSIILTSLLISVYYNPKSLFAPPNRRSALILVLGDVGRSPRMMYHTESMAKLGWDTWLVGYRGSTPLASLLSQPHVHITYLRNPPSLIQSLPFFLSAPLKIVFQCYTILYLLLTLRTEIIMVQNPPSIPTLLLAQLVTHLRSSKLVIDWHNTGYTILRLKRGEGMVVRVAEWFEKTFGKSAWLHLFVTQAMSDHLTSTWHLTGKKVVLHDRPPGHFRRCGAMEVHELFNRLLPNLTPPIPAPFLPPTGLSKKTSLFTHLQPDGSIGFRDERPALVVSSTSWTPDEDFGVLLRALSGYESAARSHSHAHAQSRSPREPAEAHDNGLPKLIVLVSGKGPLLPRFLSQYESLCHLESWTHVTIRTVWLEMSDYPVFLGSADLGISLHQSSSGLDLPMKVVDMFGCGVPVLARNFRCLKELVRQGKNGMVFENADELSTLLQETLKGFPNASKLDKLRSFFPTDHTADLPGAHARTQQRLVGEKEDWTSWDEQWTETVAPILSSR